MKIYPYAYPIILNDAVYSQYGGQGTGTFSSAILQNSYLLAEMQVSEYIGTFLLPTNVTGTYPYMHQTRVSTDWGYVNQLLSVGILSQQGGCQTCSLTSNSGCGYIYSDTYGYVDFRQLTSVCGCSGWGWPYSPYVGGFTPYQIQLAYNAGLPTGTASSPGILEALTILAQTDLNEKFSGVVGVNESVGAIGIQDFSSMDYRETRAAHALVKTALGDDARSARAKKMIDMTVRRARKALFA